MTTSSPSGDHALRYISDDGSFRILVATSSHTVRGIAQAQRPADDIRHLFADLISATVLLRLTMSPDYRLQVILKSQTAGKILGDSHPDGTTRGLLRRPNQDLFELGPSTLFSVHRAMFQGELHQGVVETSSQQTLADAVTGYLLRSEQIHSVAGLAHQFQGDTLLAAGGYIIQLLPDADDATLAMMTERLQNLPPPGDLFGRCDYNLASVAEELFGPIGFHLLGQDDFHPGCVCNHQRIVDALGSLPPQDIEALTDEEVLEINCDYCATPYQIMARELR